MALIMLEAERDVDPAGAVRDAVSSGLVTWDRLDEFVALEMTKERLCCSPAQLREYVTALLDTPPANFAY